MDLYPTTGLFYKVITRSSPESPLWGQVNQLWRWWQCPLISPDPLKKNNFKWSLEMKRSNTQSGLIGESREAFDIRERLGKGWWRISCQQWDATVSNGSSMSFVSTLCTINLLVINLLCKNRPHRSPKKIQTVESYWISGKLNLFIFVYKETFGVIKRGLENPPFSSRISQPQSLDKARQLYPIPVWFTKKIGQIPVLPSGKQT